MMKEKILKIWTALESKFVQLIDRIEPETKLMVVGIAFLFMAFISFYTIVSGIYYIGLKDGEQLQMKDTKSPVLKIEPADSINLKKQMRDGKQ
ncbi:MAG TPA: TraL conjugative transposon family protein [Flavobacterium sp.]|nr:TraL conjugative transposon family protein [Flavobacterium sp.]